MFLKFATFILAITIFSAAQANTHEGMKAAFDEFNYATTVEWDQKDQSFLELKKQELAMAIEAQGMSREDLISFTKAQLNNEVLGQNLDTVLNAVSMNEMSAEQAHSIMANAIAQAQVKGASWNGVIIMTPVGLLVLVLIIIIIT